MSRPTPDDLPAIGGDGALASAALGRAVEIGDRRPSEFVVQQSLESGSALSIPERHMPQLDGLRAVAVFAVMLQHILALRNIVFCDGFPWAYVGVQLFFVISGFLITGILLRQRERAQQLGLHPLASMKIFYCRRFLRIFPLYYAVLFVLACGFKGVRNYLVWYVAYASNILLAMQGDFSNRIGTDVAGHFWTLAIEEQFYLVWPWLILLVPRNRLAAMLWITVAVGVISRAIFVAYGATIVTTNAFTTSNLDSLALGALASYGQFRGGVRGGRLLAFGSLVSLFVLHFLAPIWVSSVFLPLCISLVGSFVVRRAAIGFGGILGFVLANPASRFLGRISYGLYVFHIPVIATLGRLNLFAFDRASSLKDCLVVILLTLFLATVSWYLFESPINKLKRRFRYI